jgi:hypothetical protein
MNPPVRKSLLAALATVSGMTLISRVLGFVRDAVIARVFGAGIATDPGVADNPPHVVVTCKPVDLIEQLNCRLERHHVIVGYQDKSALRRAHEGPNGGESREFVSLRVVGNKKFAQLGSKTHSVVAEACGVVGTTITSDHADRE